jgi:hypothetical protein
VNWTAYYTACEDSQLRIKYRDRDVAGAAWLGGGGLAPAGSGYQTSGYCKPDGQPHRWVGYATLKTATGGIVLAKTPKVYFKATAVTGDCPH